MSNMSYCRFENTYNDLRACKDALQDIQELNELSESEQKYAKRVIDLCAFIAENFGDMK